MVLIKLAEFIINVDGPRHLIGDVLKIYFAGGPRLDVSLAQDIISYMQLIDLLVHKVDAYSEDQKNYTEKSELDHRAEDGGHRPPCGQRLLLEL